MYNRQAAQEYADRWWNGRNPAYPDFAVDCTNFISQCLFAGGAPMDYTNSRVQGWWYAGRPSGGREPWSFSWAVAHSLHWYLRTSQRGLRAQTRRTARELQIGDVIQYDWNGDGRFTHSTVVTAFDGAGEPLVNAHTNNSFRRPWAYRDSPAWSRATRYHFFHIIAD
jgi:hypothetical protein